MVPTGMSNTRIWAKEAKLVPSMKKTEREKSSGYAVRLRRRASSAFLCDLLIQIALSSQEEKRRAISEFDDDNTSQLTLSCTTYLSFNMASDCIMLPVIHVAPNHSVIARRLVIKPLARWHC